MSARKAIFGIFLFLLVFTIKSVAQPHTIYGQTQGSYKYWGGGLYGQGALFELTGGQFRKFDFRTEFQSPVFAAYEINGRMFGYSNPPYDPSTNQNATYLAYLVEAESPTSPLLLTHELSYQQYITSSPDLGFSGDTLVFPSQAGLACMNLRDRKLQIMDSSNTAKYPLLHNDKVYYYDQLTLKELDLSNGSNRLISQIPRLPISKLILDGQNIFYFSRFNQQGNIVRINIVSGIADTLSKAIPNFKLLGSIHCKLNDWVIFSDTKNLGKFSTKTNEIKIITDIDTNKYPSIIAGPVELNGKIYTFNTTKDNPRLGALLEFDPILESIKEITTDSMQSAFLFPFKKELYILHSYSYRSETGYCVKVDVHTGTKQEYHPYQSYFHGFRYEKPQLWKGKLIGRNSESLLSFDIDQQKFTNLLKLHSSGSAPQYIHHNNIIVGDTLYGIGYNPDQEKYLYSIDLNTNIQKYLKPIKLGLFQDQMINYENYLFLAAASEDGYGIFRINLTTLDTTLALIYNPDKAPKNPLTRIDKKIYTVFHPGYNTDKVELFETDAETMSSRKIEAFDQYAAKGMSYNFSAIGNKLYSVADPDSTHPKNYIFSYSPQNDEFEIIYNFPAELSLQYNLTGISVADSVIYGIISDVPSPYEFEPMVFSYDLTNRNFQTYSIEDLGGLTQLPEYLVIGPKYVAHPQASNLLIYPNPGKDQFEISFKEGFNGTIEIFDMIGKRIAYQTYIDPVMKIKQDLTDNAAGCYFIRAINLNGQLVGEGRFVNY